MNDHMIMFVPAVVLLATKIGSMTRGVLVGGSQNLTIVEGPNRAKLGRRSNFECVTLNLSSTL